MVGCTALALALAPPQSQVSRSGPVGGYHIALLSITMGPRPDYELKHCTGCERRDNRGRWAHLDVQPRSLILHHNEAHFITSPPFRRYSSVTTMPPSPSLKFDSSISIFACAVSKTVRHSHVRGKDRCLLDVAAHPFALWNPSGALRRLSSTYHTFYLICGNGSSGSMHGHSRLGRARV